MAGGGPASVQKVQNGLSGLSLDTKKTISEDQMSTTSSTNGSSIGGVADKSVASISIAKAEDGTYSVCYSNGKKINEKIRTTVTSEASVADQWVTDMTTRFGSKIDKGNLVVGLDIEWNRNGRIEDGERKGQRKPVAVLQLCLAKYCLIFQIYRCDSIPASLDKFLSNEKVVFVGAGIYADARKLWVDRSLDVANTEELGTLAAFKLTNTMKDYKESKYYRTGLKDLAMDVLDMKIPKERNIQMSDWDVPTLKEEQILYACLDALVSFKLGVELKGRSNPVHSYNYKKKDTPFWKDFSKQEEANKQQEGDTKQDDTADQASGKKGQKANGNKSSKRN